MVEEGQQSMLHHLQVAHELAEQVVTGSVHQNSENMVVMAIQWNRLVQMVTNLF